ncbi:MAG: cation:dicarboxylase symporter family transporter, partial [Candidatus Marinimicrobia bacterium]|nr:cation:dicarboxylase symporter family transporter [Candidatus Neomarinimicrobiota bacterium]
MQKSPLSIIRKISLTAWVFLGIIGGIIAGLLLGTTIVPFAGFIGDVFLRLLKMIIVSLIFTSLTPGV